MGEREIKKEAKKDKVEELIIQEPRGGIGRGGGCGEKNAEGKHKRKIGRRKWMPWRRRNRRGEWAKE